MRNIAVGSLLFAKVLAAPTQLPEQPIVQATQSIDPVAFREVAIAQQYAAAAYCPSNHKYRDVNVTCAANNCPDVEKVGTKVLIPITNIPSKGDNVTGFLAHDTYYNRLVLSFRGTQSLVDIIRDINYQLTPTTSICIGCEASLGVWKTWTDIREGIIETIENHGQVNGVMVTGHSLGGAIASVAAADLRRLGRTADLITFGAPRFANKAFVQFLEQSDPQLGRNHRVTHEYDPIPEVPLTIFGHYDLYPEYSITKATRQNVTWQDIRVVHGEKMNSMATIKDWSLASHGWYFNAIAACADDVTWLLGPLPLSKTGLHDTLSWLENNNWAFFNAAWSASGSILTAILESVGFKDVQLPQSPAIEIPKDIITNWLTGGRNVSM